MIEPKLGERLYELLPAVYRVRDGNGDDSGDLRAYLGAAGELLDLVYHTLEQRLADAFPDQPETGLACQEWLLPYFADLLDVRLVSPDVRGRRAEVADAVAWRQRAGTPDVIEAIAEAVGQIEVEIQEGWKRVATTPRIGMPLLPATALGYANEPHAAPGLAARHPGLPAVTVDFRCPSRAVQTSPANPASARTRFDTAVHTWRQSSVHGAPCFPDSYEDVSRRTVDVRTPSWRHGHYHPRRVLLHAPPPAGFFPTIPPALELRVKDWDLAGTTVDYQPAPGLQPGHVADFELAAPVPDLSPPRRARLLVERAGVEHGVPVVIVRVSDTHLRLHGAPPPAALAFPAPGDRVRLVVREAVTLHWLDRAEPQYAGVLSEEVVASDPDADPDGFGGTLRVFRNRTAGTPWFVPVHISGVIELNSETATDDESYRFEDLVLRHTAIVHRNRVGLVRCAARKVVVHTIDTAAPVLVAADCLFDGVQAARGLSQLEHCTVLRATLSEELHASDCVFLGPLRRDHPPLDGAPAGCVRYSRVEPDQVTAGLSTFRVTRDPVEMFSAVFGDRGCGVLHPATPASVQHGAEDGGELGAYHDRHYSLRLVAVADKLREHMPLGVEPIVIPDPRLLEAPPG